MFCIYETSVISSQIWRGHTYKNIYNSEATQSAVSSEISYISLDSKILFVFVRWTFKCPFSHINIKVGIYKTVSTSNYYFKYDNNHTENTVCEIYISE